MPKVRSVTLMTIQFEDGPDLVVVDESPPLEAPVPPSGDPVLIREVFDYWVQRTGRDPARVKLTKERRQKIRTRLTSFSVEELERAIDWYAEDPFHQGDNDRHQRFDDITTIFKTDDKVAKALEAEPPRKVDDGRSRYRIIGE